MLRSNRFRLAVLLLILLCICLTGRVLHRARLPQETLPALSSDAAGTGTSQTESMTEAESAVPETQTTAAETERIPVESEPAELPEPHADEPELPEWKYTELRQKTDALAAQLGDLVGWIYLADSDIDYPVMQGTDNMFYLSHAPDGRELEIGSVMLDCRNDRSFQDGASILYAHNMQCGMFGDIRSFRNQSSFDAHRYGWLFTPDAVYRIDFFALAIVSGFDSAYDLPCEQPDFLERIRSQAEFDSGAAVSADDRLIALSTCAAADKAQARALFTGVLRRIYSGDAAPTPLKER